MKKINIIAITVILSSVAVFGNTPVLNNRVDSLNYALGIANGNSVRMYYMNNDITDEKVESLMKGIDEVVNNKSEYYELELLGATMGSAMKQQNEAGLLGIQGQVVKFEILKQGLINGMRGYDSQMTASDANAYLQTAMQNEQAAQMEQTYGTNRTAGEQFLAENATKEGVVVLPSGLQYKVIKEGRGQKPSATDEVRVHYHGTLIDGTVFDSSVERNEPAVFGINQVIPGWTEALQLMPVGSKWIVYIPQELAYGSADRGTIKPFSALIFEVELLGIEN